MPEYCKVLHDYEKEQGDELALVKGQIVKIVKEEDEGWWEGSIHPTGEQGWFPSNFVEKCDAPAAPAAAKQEPEAAPAKKMGMPFGAMAMPGMGGVPGLRKATKYGVQKIYAKVTFDYDAEKDDELTMKAGDMVEVTKQDDEGWWTGILQGKEGAFPSNFVELVEGGAAAPAAAKPMGPPKGGIGAAFMGAVVKTNKAEQCKVLHDYKAENSDELSLKAGDIVEITEKGVDEGWWEGKVNGQTGVFPNNFVEIIEDTTPQNAMPSIGPGMLRKSTRKQPQTKTEPEEKPSFIAGPSMLKKRTPPDVGAKPFVAGGGNTAPPAKPVQPSFVKPTPAAAIAPTPAPGPAKPAAPVAAAAPVKPAPVKPAPAPAAAKVFEKPKPAPSTASKFGGAVAPSSGPSAVATPQPKVPGGAGVSTNGPNVGGASSAEVKALQAEVKSLKAMLETAMVELGDAKREAAEAKKEVAEIKVVAADVKSVKASIGKAIAGFQKDIREARDERLKLSDKVQEVQTKIQFGI